MKRIGIDMTHYDQMSGYGIVANNIIDRLLKKQDFEFILFGIKDLNNIEIFKKNKRIKNIIITKNMNYFFYRLFYQAKLFKKHKVDIFFTCDQILPLKKKCKYICTIHDIEGPKKYKGIKAIKRIKERKLDKYFFFYLFNLDKIFAKKADKIISPSKYTKKDIVKYFKISPKKVITINWGMNHIKYNKKNIKEKYILFPMCHFFNNNFIFKLGKKILKENLAEKIIYRKPTGKKNDIPSKKNILILNKRISNKEKENLFSKALISIYISDWEGFGFIPLESMIYKTPVIYNNAGSLKEISGNGGIFLKEINIENYIKEIKKLLKNKKIYNLIIKKGITQSKKYTREKTVKKIIKEIF